MEVFYVLVLIALIVPLAIWQTKRYKRLIHEKIQAIGGIYVSHNREWGALFSSGPFKLVGRGQSVFSFTYTIHKEMREGWVKFGGFRGPDWRL